MSHLEKIRRIEASRTKLDRTADFQLWIWASMTAATHALNAAFHAVGLTDEDDVYPTQVAGVYVARDDSAAGWSRLMKPPGDVLHVGMPPLDRPVPSHLDEACVALGEIEEAGNRFVRGAAEPKSDDPSTCDAAYTRCMTLFLEAIERGGQAHAD